MKVDAAIAVSGISHILHRWLRLLLHRAHVYTASSNEKWLFFQDRFCL